MKRFTSTNDGVRWGRTIFRCPHEIEFEDVREVLLNWWYGKAEREEVMGFAEELARIGGGWPTYSRQKPKSVLFAVMELLEMMYVNPVRKEDIPALLSFLATARADSLKTWDRMEAYWDRIDRDERLSEES